MLRSLFPLAHRQYVRSPAAHWLSPFAGFLVEVGYARAPAAGHVRRLRVVLERHVGVIDGDAVFSPADLEVLFRDGGDALPWRVGAMLATRRAFTRFLMARMPERLATVPDEGAFGVLLGEYRQHLLEVRGFATATVRQHLATVTVFLDASLGAERPLSDLTRGAVEAFAVAEGRRLKRQTMQHTVARVRAFLRYCFDHCLVSERLDEIDTPRVYRDELPPRALPWSLVEALLASVDVASKGGYRDHAILHLMAHYGLRPSEVVALTVDAIDRQARTLRVAQRKTRSQLIMPISCVTLQVLDAYLAMVRPAPGQAALFLRMRSPVGPIGIDAISHLYAKRVRQSGLRITSSSPYALRHAFAMRLLEGGVSVKAIADLLGHRTLEATSVYLRLQTATLRAVALPVPFTATPDAGASA